MDKFARESRLQGSYRGIAVERQRRLEICGNLGNVIGNMSGGLSGSLSGSLSGNLVGNVSGKVIGN